MRNDDKKLLRISLQFFGEDGEDDDDFADFFDDDVPKYYGSDNGEDYDAGYSDIDLDADGDADDGADGAPSSVSGADTTSDVASATESVGSPEGEAEGDSADPGADAGADGGNADLISELRALGYQGDDIASLTADMKRKREEKQSRGASAERRAVNSASKSHLKTSAPGQSAGGDGTGGITERQVEEFSSRTGCSKDEARRLLAKHSKFME